MRKNLIYLILVILFIFTGCMKARNIDQMSMDDKMQLPKTGTSIKAFDQIYYKLDKFEEYWKKQGVHYIIKVKILDEPRKNILIEDENGIATQGRTDTKALVLDVYDHADTFDVKKNEMIKLGEPYYITPDYGKKGKDKLILRTRWGHSPLESDMEYIIFGWALKDGENNELLYRMTNQSSYLISSSKYEPSEYQKSKEYLDILEEVKTKYLNVN